MKKLISMTDFISQNLHTGCASSQLQLLHRYKDFLKQPLTLGMFVPCDENGNVLREPIDISEFHPRDWDVMNIEHSKYNKAKEKVLFEGFKKDFNSVLGPDGYLDISKLQGKTIEDIIGSNLQLTESALKQIGL